MAVIPTVPLSRSATYKAAAYIVANGPATAKELLVAVNFGALYTQKQKLQDAYDSGWLVEGLDGKVDVTPFARRHFERQAPVEKYAGQITPAQYRQNVFASPGLSKKHIPSSRGMRQDTPEWSHRSAGFGFKSIAGGGE